MSTRKRQQINVFLRKEAGFGTEKLNVLQEVQDGVVLVKNGARYHVVDARTGLDISSAKTKKEALDFFEARKPVYAKTKKDKRYSEYAILNKKDPQGNWKPQNVTFPNLVEIRSEKRGKGGKYERRHKYIIPQLTEKKLREKLRKDSETRTGLPTIRKVYGTKNGDIVKIVDYRKGYFLERISTFRPGKSPKGTKLLSKQFIK